ncbi:hypothetical protein GCM10022231_34310 [Gordonia caeni]|uniref:Uncharacterized protein n=1 Tax=Gordonia caeni TaxID=1007097 RepID=A0ABP7PRI7_9ACTN
MPSSRETGAAVLDHRHAPGVGRDHSAQCRRLSRGEIGAQGEAVLGSGPLGLGDPDAGSGREGAADRIDLVDPVHSRRRQDHLAVHRDRAADQAGVPALRDHGESGAVAEGEDGRDLGGVGGADHRGGVTVPVSGPVGDVAGHYAGVGEYVGPPDDVGQGGVQCGHGVGLLRGAGGGFGPLKRRPSAADASNADLRSGDRCCL